MTKRKECCKYCSKNMIDIESNGTKRYFCHFKHEFVAPMSVCCKYEQVTKFDYDNINWVQIED